MSISAFLNRKHRKVCVIGAILWFGILSQTALGNSALGKTSAATPFIPQLLPMSSCLGQAVQLCGHTISLPPAAFGGTIASLTMPAPFMPDPYSAQCLSTPTGSQLAIDALNVTCKIMPCAETIIPLCGRKITIPGGITIGNSVDVAVPEALLIPSALPHNLSFSARCALKNDQAEYQFPDASAISCNLFPCLESTVSLCGVEISLKGGAVLGDTETLKMPPPFVPDPFVVQCLGSQALQPSYQITDGTAVTCRMAPLAR